ncbi:MAG: TetR/AcrR family transcriptional regulator [Ruminococcus flavefaciens]|nr:TetR/AcrR family transcriptional regulator [Ruminococcus flavefaciens]
MPPKAKITRDMVIDSAFEIARTKGAEEITARTVAEKLGTSTQPVMYHFATIAELKRATYAKADIFHTEYITGFEVEKGNIMKEIGRRYIRFATEEKNLFRFLFQSDFVVGDSIAGIIDTEEAYPVVELMSRAMGLNTHKTKQVFLLVAMFAHGYASMLANNTMKYDEKTIMSHLEQAYKGALLVVKEEDYEETI